MNINGERVIEFLTTGGDTVKVIITGGYEKETLPTDRFVTPEEFDRFVEVQTKRYESVYMSRPNYIKMPHRFVEWLKINRNCGGYEGSDAIATYRGLQICETAKQQVEIF